MRFHLVRDYFSNLCFTGSDLNRADGLTKVISGRRLLDIFFPAETFKLTSEEEYDSDDEDDDFNPAV